MKAEKKEYTATMEMLWSKSVAEKGFARVPALLIKHFLVLGLSIEEFYVAVWIILHQRSQRPAFPHPAGLAKAMGKETHEVIAILKSLKERSLLSLEPTKNQKNYYQDLRPLRNALAQLSVELTRIDTSSNQVTNLRDESIPINASIPEGVANPKSESLGEIIARKSKDDAGR